MASSLFYSDLLVRKVLGPADDSDVFFQEYTDGGHFPAFEVPGLFVDDIRAFFRTLRA